MSACPWGVPVGPACAKLWSAQHVTTLHSQYLHAAHGNVSVIVMSNDVFNMRLCNSQGSRFSQSPPVWRDWRD